VNAQVSFLLPHTAGLTAVASLVGFTDQRESRGERRRRQPGADESSADQKARLSSQPLARLKRGALISSPVRPIVLVPVSG